VATTRPRNAAPVEARLRTAGGEWRWLSFAAGDRIESPTGVVLSARVLADERLHDRQDDRLDTLARTVSHDLRTPLSVASGSLALYRQTGDGELLDRIQRAHERIEQLTAELLAHARQGRVVDDTHPVSLRDCAVAALSTTPLPADRVTVAETLPTVEGDDSRVRALFENLFRNVADHAGPDTRVWVERLPAPPGRDATDGRGAGGGPGADDGRDEDDAIGGFVVEDDGPGIPAADAESVFEPGYSTDADGTGLGLDIVAAIAAAHGWEVTVTEGRAGGARFEFRGVDVADEA
jgi:signal transduction histidine kinase